MKGMLGFAKGPFLKLGNNVHRPCDSSYDTGVSLERKSHSDHRTREDTDQFIAKRNENIHLSM